MTLHDEGAIREGSRVSVISKICYAISCRSFTACLSGMLTNTCDVADATNKPAADNYRHSVDHRLTLFTDSPCSRI